MVRQADASPTKGFFIDMIVKDISLDDCVLDLLDNCLDGARKTLTRRSEDLQDGISYAGFEASITLSGESFNISDNCGGISIAEAIEYAFHFGRLRDAPREDGSIGLYGIGMKRAIFKIGKEIDIYSSTDAEAFSTHIDVDEWRKDETEHWEFDLEDADVSDSPGTSITVRRLNEGVATAFQDAVFLNALKRTIARDYAFFLKNHFDVILNGQHIQGFEFRVRESDDFHPVRRSYLDPDGVQVEIIAGMAGLPPDDTSPDQCLPEREYYGWFVVCNDRVVLAADKSAETVWTQEDNLSWHPQYNGFLGIARFYSSDPAPPPWDTTKRKLDQENRVYRRAVTRMKEVTRQWVRYTN